MSIASRGSGPADPFRVTPAGVGYLRKRLGGTGPKEAA